MDGNRTDLDDEGCNSGHTWIEIWIFERQVGGAINFNDAPAKTSHYAVVINPHDECCFPEDMGGELRLYLWEHLRHG